MSDRAKLTEMRRLPRPRARTSRRWDVMTYRIETRPEHSDDPLAWTQQGMGDVLDFHTWLSAHQTMRILRGLGEDWAMAQYRIVEVEA